MGNVIRRDRGKVGTLREEFTDQAICIFVGAALPGSAGVGEIKRDMAKGFGNGSIPNSV
mgnify:CR=1 FL=1